MKNCIQNDGDAVDFIAPSGGVVGGAGYLLGVLFGVARHTAAQGVQTILDTEGVFTLPKAASITPAPGAALYWDDTNKVVTTTVGSNVKIGVHTGLVAAGAADATLPVRLNGTA